MNSVLARFLSEENLDLPFLSTPNFSSYLHKRFASFKLPMSKDLHVYRHGCFAVEPGWESILQLIRSRVL